MNSGKSNIKPLLTIVVPVYNTEKYIEKCLLSLVDDRLKNKIEVIVVSDGSKDNSIKIAKKIQKKYPNRFLIIEKENGGHGSTINVGVKTARGKYFRVLDSDDWFDKEEFFRFVSYLEKCNSDLVITDYSKEYVNDGISQPISYEHLVKSKEYKFNTFDLKLLDNNFFAMATITYKTKILKDINFMLPEKTFYVDMIYDVVPILNIETFTYFDCNVYKYFIGRIGQSVNTASYAKNHLNHDRVTRNLIEFYEENKNKIKGSKKKYLKIIIKTVINTHYAIYCIFYKKSREGYKYAKAFDAYFSNKSKDLYKDTNDGIVSIYRKTKFIFVLIILHSLKMFMYKTYIKINNKGGK